MQTLVHWQEASTNCLFGQHESFLRLEEIVTRGVDGELKQEGLLFPYFALIKIGKLSLQLRSMLSNLNKRLS